MKESLLKILKNFIFLIRPMGSMQKQQKSFTHGWKDLQKKEQKS